MNEKDILAEAERVLSMVQQQRAQVMTKTCTKTAGLVGETITLKASGSGGTPPYTIIFRKDGVELTRFTGVPANIEKTHAYVLAAGDVGTRNFSSEVIDTCPAGAKTCSETCPVVVSECALPVCSFTVA